MSPSTNLAPLSFFVCTEHVLHRVPVGKKPAFTRNVTIPNDGAKCPSTT